MRELRRRELGATRARHVSRLAFLGTPAAAVPFLEALVDAGHDIALVVSQPDKRRGRGTRWSPAR